MAINRKTGGRQKGTPNQLTASARMAFRAAFDGVGGVEVLTRWAKDNLTEFYRIYARLIPADVQVDHQVDISSRYDENHVAALNRYVERIISERNQNNK